MKIRKIVSSDSTDQTYNIINWQRPFTWLWRGLPLRLSKRQSPTTVLFRTINTRTVTQYELQFRELLWIGRSFRAKIRNRKKQPESSKSIVKRSARPAHKYIKTITISKFKGIQSNADPVKSYLAIIADPVAFTPMLAATKNLWCGSWGWSFKMTLFTELGSTLTALKSKENLFNVLLKKARPAWQATIASSVSMEWVFLLLV